MLLEKPGEIITREEMRQRLWASDTFVDFEHSLNTAIKKLRGALGDSPENSRYIETVPRVGYRFIAPLSAPENDSENASKTELGNESSGSAGRAHAGNKFWMWLALASVFLLAGSVALFLALARATRTLSETDPVLITDFLNSTSDPVFDDTLKQAISVQLAQSPFINIVSDAKVSAALRLMTKAVDTKLTPEIARDVCQRTGAQAYISGSIANLGRQYVIGLNVIDCQTDDPLVREQVVADNKEHVLKALGEGTTTLRNRLGESLTTIQKFGLPIEEVTTPSLEALKAFAEGRKIQQVKGNAAAIPSFERAIELDPNFSAAYAALGTSYSNLREPELAAENLRKAYELRDHVSEREKFRISAYYQHLVSGDIEKAIGTYELWAQAYPRDNVPHSNLGVIYGYLGQYERAVTEIQAALRLNPDSAVGYTNLVSHYAALNQFEEAKAIFRRAAERKLDNPYLHLNLYGVAFVQGDAQEMQRQMDWGAGKVQAEDLLLSGHSDTEAYWGKLKKAREFSQRAVEAALSHEQKETAAEWQMNAALREAEFANTAQAHAQATSALAASSNRELQILAALVLARTGDSNRAARMADDLAKRFPVDTGVNRYWLPTIRAAIEINHKNPAKAVEVLQAAAPYELGNPLPQAEIGAFLYPVYLRGQCYLQLHRGQEAAAEFQKFLDHQGITINSPLGALAHLGLARAYASQSDSTKARKAYDEFFALWKDADPDLRILTEAKEEYAKLK
jgi:tetratricopeptide (TPR) repeat protein